MSRKDPLPRMPVDHIDWKLDPEVNAMSPTARAGYMDLLLSQWYLGALPDDDKQLRGFSRLSSREWKKERETILKHFHKQIDGTLMQNRCKEERDLAISMLEEKRKAGKIGGDASARKRLEPQEDRPQNTTIEKPSIRQASVEHTSTRTLQDITLQDTTSSPPTPPPGVDVLPFRMEDIPERTGTVPLSAMTASDYEPQKKLLLERYVAVAAECNYTPEEVLANFDELFTDSKHRPRPIQQVLRYLHELAPFDAGQVVSAMDVYGARQQTKGEANAPLSYFMALVREDAGHYQRPLEKKEIAADVQKSREARSRAQAEPVGRSGANSAPKRLPDGVKTAGDVLRTLPKMRRACAAQEQAPAEGGDGLPP